MNKPIGSLNPHGGPVLRKSTVTNSITIADNDYLIATSGFAALGTTGTLLLGVSTGLVDRRGSGMETTGVAGAETGSYVGTFLTASDNQTVGLVTSLVNISKDTLYSVDPDVAIATTTGSNLLGYHTDIADEDETDENTAATGTAQLFIWGVDPADSGNQVVNIYESVISGV